MGRPKIPDDVKFESCVDKTAGDRGVLPAVGRHPAGGLMNIFSVISRGVLALERIASAYEQSNEQSTRMAHEQYEMLVGAQQQARVAHEEAERFRVEQRAHMQVCERLYQERLNTGVDIPDGPVMH